MRHFLPSGALFLALAACTNESLDPQPSETDAMGARDLPDEPSAPRPSGKHEPREGAPELERHVWYEAGVEREAWLDPATLADHAPSEKSRAALLARAPLARELGASDARVRFWQLPAGAPRSSDLARALGEAGADGRFSPVFHAAPDPQSPRSSLPGGALVSFGSDWTIDAAQAWLAGRGLAIERRLELAQPTFVVASPPGLAALELANELAAAPQVRWAQPDWWLQVSPK